MEDNNKPSYEQLEAITKAFQNRMMQAEAQLQHINLTKLTLDYLFKVLDKADKFNPQFVSKCAKEIENTLFAYTEEETTQQDTKEAE